MNSLEMAVPFVASSLILSRLRLETRPEHEAVEKLLDLMSASLTPDRYRQRLEQFYGFYRPMEDALREQGKQGEGDALDAALSDSTRSAMSSRLIKTSHLNRDLQALGAAPDGLPLCRQLPPLDNQAQLLGCMYVLEGATLGGRMITQHVRATLGITQATGGSFFEGYGDDTAKMWQGMRQLLVSSATDVPAEDAMVASAIATFACLGRWCQSNQKSLASETAQHA